MFICLRLDAFNDFSVTNGIEIIIMFFVLHFFDIGHLTTLQL